MGTDSTDEVLVVSEGLIRSHSDLRVYQQAFDIATQGFNVSRGFPIEERYSLTDQIRRSSRSVTANIAEAWRKRRYPAAFVSKLNDAEAEAAETQSWLQHSVACGYLEMDSGRTLHAAYDNILGALVKMQNDAHAWTGPLKK